MQENLLILVDKMQDGKLKYFDDFYELTKKSVFYNILSLTKNTDLSEDLLHDTYMKFLKNLDKVDKTKSILGYLIMISRSVTLDHFKKFNRVENLDEDDLKHISDEKDENKYEIEILLNKISNILKDTEYEIFSQHVLGDLTFKEISIQLNKPLGTILATYNSAIKKIRKEINYEEFSR